MASKYELPWAAVAPGEGNRHWTAFTLGLEPNDEVMSAPAIGDPRQFIEGIVQRHNEGLRRRHNIPAEAAVNSPIWWQHLPHEHLMEGSGHGEPQMCKLCWEDQPAIWAAAASQEA